MTLWSQRVSSAQLTTSMTTPFEVAGPLLITNITLCIRLVDIMAS